MAILKPSPSLPNIFSAGTITLFKIILQEDAALIPNLSSLLPFVKPEKQNNYCIYIFLISNLYNKNHYIVTLFHQRSIIIHYYIY